MTLEKIDRLKSLLGIPEKAVTNPNILFNQMLGDKYDIKSFQEALEYIGDINNIDGSALHMAIDTGRIDVAMLLLDKGANPNDDRGKDGQKILAKAIDIGNRNLVKKLLDKGAEIDTTAYTTPETRMCEYAIVQKKYDIANTLLVNLLKRDAKKFQTELNKISSISKPVKNFTELLIKQPSQVENFLNLVFVFSKYGDLLPSPKEIAQDKLEELLITVVIGIVEVLLIKQFKNPHSISSFSQLFNPTEHRALLTRGR